MSSGVRRWLVVAVLLFVGASAAWAANEPVLPPDTVPVEPGPGQKVFPYYNPWQVVTQDGGGCAEQTLDQGELGH